MKFDYALIGVMAFLVGIVLLLIAYSDQTIEAVPSVTQQDLRKMVDQWMNNPQKDDMTQRLEIMKAYYTFEESGQKLTTDQDGLQLMNQIRKMVSLDIPKEELDQIKEDIRDQLR